LEYDKKRRVMEEKKVKLAQFPSRENSGRKKSNDDKTKKVYNRRQEELNKFKALPPAYNGWWYYEMFSRDIFYAYQRGKNKK
tara:strand:+ start:258 stop:503 length:246 start_codon:yes stop_codon:yes gene_type:complete